MKITFNGPKEKMKKKNSYSKINDSKKNKIQQITNDCTKYYKTPQGFSFQVPIGSYGKEIPYNNNEIFSNQYDNRKQYLNQYKNQEFLLNKYNNNKEAIANQYKNQEMIENHKALPSKILKNSVDSEIEFLLTSSIENKINAKSNSLESITNKKPVKIDKKSNSMEKNIKLADQLIKIDNYTSKETIISNIEQILKEKEESLKDILFNIPHYFYALKNEYLIFKEKYEKNCLNYLEEKNIVKILNEKIKEIIKNNEENIEKRKILENENEILKEENKIYKNFIFEKDNLILALKNDNTKKNNEIKNYIKENGELKWTNTKLINENELIEREIKENKNNFIKLDNEKAVLKKEVENLKEFVQKFVKNITNSCIFKDLEKILEENRKLATFQHFYEKIDLKIFELKNLTILLKNFVENQKVEIIYAIENIVKKTNLEKKEILKIYELSSKIKKINSKNITDLNQLKSLFSIDKIKSEFMEIIKTQKNEFEIEKQEYEKRIKELVEKTEEDLWDVFK